MRKWITPLLLLCLLAATVSLSYAQAPKTVTLSATDKPATEVAAEISKQLGFPVAIVGASPDKITLELLVGL